MARKLECRHCGAFNTAGTPCRCGGPKIVESYENNVIEFEGSLNDSLDKYFSARPNLERDRNKELLFEAGFRMARDIYRKET